MKARSQDPRPYVVATSEDAVVADALRILESRLRQPGLAMSTPQLVKDFLRLELAEDEHETFCALWLDAQNRLIVFDRMFTGTLTQTSVYPREVLKAALQHNAAAVIFSHNHPSGLAEPSKSDELLTENLKKSLALIDVRVLDHVIVGGMNTMSFAERGLI